MLSEKRFPECFPDKFREKLIAAGAKEQELYVYRICKAGIVDDAAFWGTFEESFRKGKARKFKVPDDVGNYSTSCHMEIKDSKHVLKFSLRNPPKAIIAKGKIRPEKGLSQITSERNPTQVDSHVDWWIYADAHPSLDFEEVSTDD